MNITLSVFHGLIDLVAGYFDFSAIWAYSSPKPVPLYVIVEDSEEAGEPEREQFKPISARTRFARRKSVSCDPYNPEEDTDEDEIVVHKKTDVQRRRLVESARSILLFRPLDHEEMHRVIDAMYELQVAPGERIITEGDDGDNFYIIESGSYDVFINKEEGARRVGQFEGKGSFGELALMYNQPRSASVIAVTKGTIWAMDRKSFRRIVLKSAFKKRKLYEEFLDTVPMLKSLEHYERMNLADALIPRTFADTECIIKEGDEADGLYFVEDGILRITMMKDGKETEIARVGKGKYFGEMALVEKKPRSASVYAVGKVKLAFCERDSFERLLGPCLDIMKRNIESYKKGS